MRQSSRTPRTRAKRQQLSAFIQAKRATDDRNARRCSSLGQGARAPLASHFSPERHNLTEEECREANQLLRKAERERPLRGDSRQVRFRHALRCAGIVSAVKRQVLGNSAFGRSLHAHRGGNVMRDHGLHILLANAPRGAEASKVAREKRTAQEHWEATGEILMPGMKPAPSKEAQRIQDLTALWEEQQWQTQQLEHLRW